MIKQTQNKITDKCWCQKRDVSAILFFIFHWYDMPAIMRLHPEWPQLLYECPLWTWGNCLVFISPPN